MAVGRITPREVVQMRNALTAIAPIKALCEHADLDALRAIGEQLNPCALLRARLAREIVDDAPPATNRGTVLRPGVDS